MSNNNNNNSIINLSLSTVIIFAGIVMFLWFAFQTLFQILYHNIMKEYAELDCKKYQQNELREVIIK